MNDPAKTLETASRLIMQGLMLLLRNACLMENMQLNEYCPETLKLYHHASLFMRWRRPTIAAKLERHVDPLAKIEMLRVRETRPFGDTLGRYVSLNADYAWLSLGFGTKHCISRFVKLFFHECCHVKQYRDGEIVFDKSKQLIDRAELESCAEAFSEKCINKLSILTDAQCGMTAMLKYATLLSTAYCDIDRLTYRKDELMNIVSLDSWKNAIYELADK